jgi:hypothetical protein
LSPYEERSVGVTLTKQFNRLNEESIDISNLFKVLSFLDPDNIPAEMIVNGAKEWLSSQDELPHAPSPSKPVGISSESRSLVALILSPIRFRTAIQKLQNLSLVEHRTDSGNSLLWMHDLIRFTIQEGARKEETYREWFQSSVSLICAAFRRIEDPKSPQRWTECDVFMPHLRSLNQRWNSLYSGNLELMQAGLVWS